MLAGGEDEVARTCRECEGPAILPVQMGFLKVSSGTAVWHRSSYATDFAKSEMASLGVRPKPSNQRFDLRPGLGSYSVLGFGERKCGLSTRVYEVFFLPLVGVLVKPDDIDG